MRLAILRNAVGVVHVMKAEGKGAKGARAIGRLTRALQIKKRDLDEVRRVFSGMSVDGNLDAVLDAMALRRGRERGEGRREELRKIDATRAAAGRADREREELVQQARDELAQLAPAWADNMGTTLAGGLVFVVISALEAYDPTKCCDVEQLVESLSPDGMLAGLNEHLPQVQQALREIIDQFNNWGYRVRFLCNSLGEVVDQSNKRWRPLPRQLYRRADELWNLILSDDGGWATALSEVRSAGVALLVSKPSGVVQFIKGGALGYGGAMLGPLGLIAAAAAAYFSDKNAQERFEGAIARWNAAVQNFTHATERWAEIAAHHFISYLEDELVPEIDLSIQSIHATTAVVDPRAPVLLMRADLEESQEAETSEEPEATVAGE